MSTDMDFCKTSLLRIEFCALLSILELLCVAAVMHSKLRREIKSVESDQTLTWKMREYVNNWLKSEDVETLKSPQN